MLLLKQKQVVYVSCCRYDIIVSEFYTILIIVISDLPYRSANHVYHIQQYSYDLDSFLLPRRFLSLFHSSDSRRGDNTFF